MLIDLAGFASSKVYLFDNVTTLSINSSWNSSVKEFTFSWN